MKFLIDNSLSPVLASLLQQSNHDAVHVRSVGLQRAEDAVIFDRAAAADQVIVAADTDFGTLLAARGSQKPSVIQFRGEGSRAPEVLARLIIANLSQFRDALESGSIVTIEPARIRVRALPIGTSVTGKE